jgi:hypothetical protein
MQSSISHPLDHIFENLKNEQHITKDTWHISHTKHKNIVACHNQMTHKFLKMT